MLDRQAGWFVVECDKCAETFDTEEAEFYKALGSIKCEGWTSRKIGSEWTHSCPSCRS